MLQSIILFTLLGTCIARGGRRRNPCRDDVDLTTQDQDLKNLLIPFTGVASDGDAVALSDSTKCVLRGLHGSWPHEDAENPVERRLLRRRRRSKVAFDVTSQTIGALTKKSRNEYTCYPDGEVSLSFKSAEVTLSDDSQVVYTADVPPRRFLHRNGDSSSDDEEPRLPVAVVTLTQTNSFGEEEEDDTVTFDLSVECRPWYKFDEDAAEGEQCTLHGLGCHDGEYSYLVTEEDETTQETEEKWFGGMRCISGDDDFLNNWETTCQ